MAMTLDDLRKVFGDSGPPDTPERVKGYIAGKASQWLNQQSHICRTVSIDKSVEITNAIFNDWMYEMCMPDGTFNQDAAYAIAETVFSILVYHYRLNLDE